MMPIIHSPFLNSIVYHLFILYTNLSLLAHFPPLYFLNFCSRKLTIIICKNIFSIGKNVNCLTSIVILDKQGRIKNLSHLRK